MRSLVILSLVMVLSGSCKPTRGQVDHQGITGKILWFEGNMMPGPGKKDTGGKPVQREIYIYQRTNMKTATATDSFYKNIPSQLVKKVQSDALGHFSVQLPAGRYSLFTKEERGLFANRFDAEGNINPVEVKEGEFTPVTIEINYKATY